MLLAKDALLGPYRIVASLGAGGMGEVYKAVDGRIDRTVAIKVLSDGLADAQLRERLKREARSIASLNHPHICTLYELGSADGLDFLVMEFLDGETLAQRLTRGALPLDQVLTIGIQIAGALTAAHRQGMVHRDLKPANIMVTKGGAKLLDFGLAKLHQPADGGLDPGLMSTMAAGLTTVGTIVGTLQYIAPEQLEAQDVDARADLFALGAIIYEMATGRRAFESVSAAGTISSILERTPPPVTVINASLPPWLDLVVSACLKKDREERFQSARDVRRHLEWIRDGAHGGAAIRVPDGRGRRRAWVVAAAALAAAAVQSVFLIRPAPPGPPVVVSDLNPPENGAYAPLSPPELSPDGQRLVAAVVAADGRTALWERSLFSHEMRPLPGTEGGFFPAWSPDGRAIAFATIEGRVKIYDGSAAPQTIATGLNPTGVAWSGDGRLLLGTTAGPLLVLPVSGGTPQPATELDTSRGAIAHSAPTFLPDGRHFLYVALRQTAGATIPDLYLGSLDSPRGRLLVTDASRGVYAAGHVVYARERNLMALPFDLRRLEAAGEPFRAGLTSIHTDLDTHTATLSAAKNGLLVYFPSANKRSRLVWYDRQGRALRVLGEPAFYAAARLSPDGRRLAVTRYEDELQRHGDLWIHDLARGGETRLTAETGTYASVVWSPDGTRVAFAMARQGTFDLFTDSVSGGALTPLWQSKLTKEPFDWSPEGPVLLFTQYDPETANDIWLLPLAGGEPKPFLRTRFGEQHPRLSPDGRWVAYTADDTGRNEVYVRAFPDRGDKWQVSAGGGRLPRWHRDGREIYYVSMTGDLMAVPVTPDRRFDAGSPVRLFEIPHARSFRTHYDATADGQHFVVVTPVADTSRIPLTLVANWTPQRP